MPRGARRTVVAALLGLAAAGASSAPAAAVPLEAGRLASAGASAAGPPPPAARPATSPRVYAADGPLARGAGAPLRAAAVPGGPDRPLAGANLARVIFPTTAMSRPGGGRRMTSLSPFAPFGGGEAQYRADLQRLVGGRLWIRVALPRRPNGTTGWVPADDVALLRTEWSVRIDRRARTLSVAHRGRTVKRVPVVVGADASPTPAGRFAISEFLPQRPATGFFGSWIVPITAFSDTYTEFMGGPGRVAIHGRGAKALRDPLGTAASHGCVRMSNGDVAWLANRLEPGVPVTIV